jgi:hypothetical protein
MNYEWLDIGVNDSPFLYELATGNMQCIYIPTEDRPWRVEVKPADKWICVGTWKTDVEAKKEAIRHYERFVEYEKRNKN